MDYILPLIVLVPFMALIPLMLLGKKHSYLIAVCASIISFLLVAYAAYSFYSGQAVGTFSHAFLPEFGVNFSLQVTPYSMLLLIMTSVVFVAASMVGKYFIGSRDRLYGTLFLIAEGSSLGVFLSANLAFLYIFWEITEVMVFFIIFIYGGYNRRYASIKFILYSIVSSLLLLIGIMVLYSAIHTFNIDSILASRSSISGTVQLAALILLSLSFLIKVPVFPFHTWLPDAHTEAPTTGSMVLAGVLLKFGGYGFLLIFLMLPIAASFAPYFFLIFLFSAIYSGLVSVRQLNVKRLIAYTSITDMGVVGVGLATVSVFGYNGAVYAMLSHGMAISVLFLIAGTLDELYGTLEISKIKGVVKSFPAIAYLFIGGVFAALGIPLTSGFIADLLIFISSSASFGAAGLLPLAGIFMIGMAMFWLIERSFMNSSHEVLPYNSLDRSVVIAGVFLIAATVVFGIVPSLFFGL